MSDATQGFGSFGNVKFDRRLPNLPRGTYPVTLIESRRHTTKKGEDAAENVGVMTSVLVVGRESEGPKGWRIQMSGLEFPRYALQDLKELTAAIMGFAQSTPQALALDTPDWGKIADAPATYKGKRFVVTVTGSGRYSKPKGNRKPEEYLSVRCRAFEPGDEALTAPVETAADAADRKAADAENAAAAAAQGAAQAQPAAPPPPPASVAAVDVGGPWYDMAPDARGNQYRVVDGVYQFRTK